MKYLQLDAAERTLPFYLAMEEYAARFVDTDDVLFMWQVSPTVIIGRNQVLDDEVDVDYCRRHGIAVYRRKSGGGCVFADRNNVMMSYITRGDAVAETFARYTATVASMLRDLGVNATAGGRNDVLIDGMKVSGGAFYHRRGVCIAHSTMLIDSDMEHISHAITPSRSKLHSKGVASVPSRITTLRRHLAITPAEFIEHARAALTDGTIELNATDVRHIEELMQDYLRESFIAGRHSRPDVQRRGRIDGVGEMQASIKLASDGTILDVTLTGDYFVTGDVDQVLGSLRGVPLEKAAIAEAMAATPVDRAILHLTNEEFMNFLTN